MLFNFLPVKVNEMVTFVEDGMDGEIAFDDFSEDEEDTRDDLDLVRYKL